MQNKANFKKARMDVNIYLQRDYGNKSAFAVTENKPKQTQSQAPTPKGPARRYAGKLSAALGRRRNWLLWLMDMVLCRNRLRIHSYEKCGLSPQFLACVLFPRAVLYSQYATPSNKVVPSTAPTGSVNGSSMPSRLSILTSRSSM
jgi:hypothetical protein